MIDENRPMDRRRFFREGLRGLIRPLSAAVKPLENVAQQISKLDPPAPPSGSTPPVTKPPASTVARGSEPLGEEEYWLRPPGSIAEQTFRSACSRCGECVRVCPVQAIRIDSGYLGFGFPYIDADRMACVMCDSLACMAHCPSGAILQIPREKISMGLAVWNQQSCLRSVGQDCSICVDHCPVGQAALKLENNRIDVLPGCTGCGVCQHDCPTLPKSIVVKPNSELAAESHG